MSHSRKTRLGLLLGALLLAASACSEEPDSGTGGSGTLPTSAYTAPTSTSSASLPAPNATDKKVPTASGAFPQARTSPGQRVDTITFLNMVITHADQRVWVPYFAALKLQEPMVSIVYVGSQQNKTFQSGCDLDDNGKLDDVVFANSPNAWYCPADGGTSRGALVLPVTTFSDMWKGRVLGNASLRGGDFAAAVVVAHEFGHHVAAELAEQLNVPEESGKGPELIADCFAAIWAAGANAHGYLETGDLEEGIAAMVAVGVNGSKTHGSPTERAEAFMVGWNAQHKPYTCMSRYWPSMAQKLATM